MHNRNALMPFHIWMPIENAAEGGETELHLSSDGESVELVFVADGGVGTVHYLSPHDFTRLLDLAAENLRLSAPSLENR